MHQTLNIKTSGRGIYDITKEVITIVKERNVNNSLCNVFCQHTSCSLILCENYDPSVKIDIEYFLNNLVTDGNKNFTHQIEGPDDMPSHIRSILTASSINIPIIKGALALGKWQGLCLYEHRYHIYERNVIISIL